MTICIAAACDKGQKIVVAADRMITAGAPLNFEFEPPLSKIEVLAKGCVALASGSLPFADQIITEVRQQVSVDPPLSVSHVCEAVKQSYVAFRSRVVDDQIVLAALGKDYQDWRSRGVPLPQYLGAQSGIYQAIVMRTEGYNLGLELLIAGIDGAGVNIAVIANPGQIVALKKLGYAAIGSGAIHALSMFHLGGQDAQMSVAETLVNAYRAKCAAEVAPGVGRETDMAIVSATETWPCPPALTHGIKEVHKQYAQRERPDCGEVQKIYESEHGKTA